MILTALAIEARAIESALSEARAGFDVRVVGPKAPRLPADLRSDNCRGLVMAGLAGGLDPSLARGAVVLDGGIHTAASIVATPDEKARLFAATRASVVDLETARARDLASRVGVPFVAIRTVLDTSGEALEPWLLGLVDDEGRVRVAAVTALLLRRPGRLGSLLRVRASSRVALRSLAVAVRERVVDPGWPNPRA